jgi:hypothetical protein
MKSINKVPSDKFFTPADMQRRVKSNLLVIAGYPDLSLTVFYLLVIAGCTDLSLTAFYLLASLYFICW